MRFWALCPGRAKNWRQSIHEIRSQFWIVYIVFVRDTCVENLRQVPVERDPNPALVFCLENQNLISPDEIRLVDLVGSPFRNPGRPNGESG